MTLSPAGEPTDAMVEAARKVEGDLVVEKSGDKSGEALAYRIKQALTKLPNGWLRNDPDELVAAIWRTILSPSPPERMETTEEERAEFMATFAASFDFRKRLCRDFDRLAAELATAKRERDGAWNAGLVAAWDLCIQNGHDRTAEAIRALKRPNVDPK